MKVYVSQINTATEQNLLPLAAGLMVSAAASDDEVRNCCDFEIRSERTDPAATARRLELPAVLGFSCYAWNTQHSLAVAREAKRLSPASVVVLGGPELPRDPPNLHKWLDEMPFVDAIVFGEGEVTFKELIGRLAREQDLSDVRGLAMRRSNGEVTVNEPQPRIVDFSELNSPFLDGTFERFLQSRPNEITGALWETNRGCPFSCTFCDWGQAINAKVHDLPLERLERELEWIGRQQFFFVWAVDANFGIRPRDVEIAHAMGRVKAQYGYPRSLSVSWAKNSPDRVKTIHEILRDAGVECQITLSMQSFNPSALIAVKRKNIKLGAFAALKDAFAESDVPTYSEFILPLPEETYDSFVDGLVTGLSPHPKDFFAVNMCRLLANSELAKAEQRERYGFETRICEIKVARRRSDESVVSEREELLVGTSTMPVPEWQKSVQFSFLISCLYNHRLADVVINALHRLFGLSIREFVEHLLWQTDGSPVLQRIRENLQGHIDSILVGRTPMRQVPEYGEFYWEPNESCYLIAALDTGRFLGELRTATQSFLDARPGVEVDPALVDELFRFQTRMIPRHGDGYPITDEFTWDWYAFYRKTTFHRTEPLEKRNVRLAFELAAPDGSLVLNDQQQLSRSPQQPADAKSFAMAQIKVTAVGKNAVCKVRYA
jgi:putative methyltransferase